MTAFYTFEIPGKPVGKQRPRMNTKSHRTYTPKETVNYEALIKMAFAEKYPDAIPEDGRVYMVVDAYFQIPASWSKKKKQGALDGELAPGKPDWDNIGKAVSDALNGIAYKDDAQVCQCMVIKRYGERPFVRVAIEVD